MATWQKLIVSGSDAVVNSVTVGSQALTATAATTKISGSFSGSFVGDGSGLVGVTAAGTVSSSAQVTALLPTGTVSSSGQVSFTGLSNLSAGIVSSSGQVAPLLPAGTVSSSAQLPAGTVSSSGQIDYNSITNKLSGVVSASAQVTPLLPAGTVSSSAQVDVRSTTGIATLATTGSNTFVGNQTISGSVIVTSGVTASAFKGDGSQLTNIGAASLPGGIVSSSGQISYTGVTNIPTDIVSSSTQVTAFLPGGTVSSSAQVTADLPVGTVSSSGQVSFTGLSNLSAGIVSSSAQVAPLIPAGTISSSGQVSLGSISGTTFASSNFTFPANLTVSGDLFVDGTTTTVNTTNLNIEDRFVLVNSGSVLGGNAQGGLVVQDSASPSGSALFYTTAGSTNRWGLADSIAYNAASATQTAYVAAVVDMNVAAQAAAVSTYAKVGNIRVDTNGDIFIYAG